MHRFLRPGLLLALAVAIACSDANSLGDPTQTNVTDTVTLGAIEGTSIAVPSGYNISRGAIRTDQVDFEFAYNVRKLADGTYQHVFLPRAALGLASANSADPGLIPRAQQRLHRRLRRPDPTGGAVRGALTRGVHQPRRTALRQARDSHLSRQHR